MQVLRSLKQPHTPHNISRKYQSRIPFLPLGNAGQRADIRSLDSAYFHPGLTFPAHLNQRVLRQRLDGTPLRLPPGFHPSVRSIRHSTQGKQSHQHPARNLHHRPHSLKSLRNSAYLPPAARAPQLGTLSQVSHQPSPLRPHQAIIENWCAILSAEIRAILERQRKGYSSEIRGVQTVYSFVLFHGQLNIAPNRRTT